MSEANQFRQYADEALGGSASPQQNKRNGMTDLACIWAQAALQSERIFGLDASPPKAERRRASVLPGPPLTRTRSPRGRCCASDLDVIERGEMQ
jgi:hypothetical protein